MVINSSNQDLISKVESPETPGNSERSQPQTWIFDNVLAPGANAGIQLYDAAANLSGLGGLPEVHLVDAPKAKTYSAEWFAQSISSGLVSMVPYIIAGKLTGGMLRGVGGALEGTSLELPSVAAKIVASERTATIVGAGLLDGSRDPGKDGSRWRNALGGMVAFSAFEGGNFLSKSLPLSSALVPRLATGFVGGTIGQITAQGYNHDTIQAGVAGAAMNAFLPEAQRGANAVGDALVNNPFGRGIPAARLAQSRGWDTASMSNLIKQTPFTRVRVGEFDGAEINQARNLVDMRPSDGAAVLAHELQERIEGTDPITEARYIESARHLSSGSEADTDKAWSKFRQIRLDQQTAALMTENMIAAERGEAKRSLDDVPAQIASGDKSYEQLWQAEFARFKDSQGTWRPIVDHHGDSGLGGGHDGTGGGHLSAHQDAVDPITGQYARNSTQNVVIWRDQFKKYIQLRGERQERFPFDSITVDGVTTSRFVAVDQQYGSPFTIGAYDGAEGQTVRGTSLIRQSVEGKPNSILMERVERPNGGYVELYPHGVAHEKYGIITKEDFDPAEARTIYKVAKGSNNIIDGSVVEEHLHGKQTMHHELVQLIERLPNGDVVYTKYPGPDGVVRQGFDYAKPEENGGVVRNDQRMDGSEIWERSDGSVTERFASPYKSSLGDISVVRRSPDGSQVYLTDDGTRIDIKTENHEFLITKTPPDGQPQTTRSTDPIVEEFPNSEFPQGKTSARGQVKRIEYYPDFARYFRNTNGTTIQEYYSPVQVENVGTVKFVVYKPEVTEYWRPDASRYLDFNPPQKIDGKMVVAQDIDSNDNATTYLENGGVVRAGADSTVEAHPQGLATSLGTFTQVKKSMDHFIYSKADGSTIEVPMDGGTIIERTADGIRDLNIDKLTEDYPKGLETRFGLATKAVVRTDGSITFSIKGDNHGVIGVIDYLVPRATENGHMTHILLMRDGSQRPFYTG